MDKLWQSGLLGLVQGLTEFLPISSSGHLVLAGDLLQLPEENFLFDAILHLATLLAVAVYFRREIGLLLKPSSWRQQERGQLWLQLTLATLPALLMGLFFLNFIESFFQKPLIVAGLMILTGLFLIGFERLALPEKIPLSRLKIWQSLGIGLAQGLALLPGISRLGLTLGAGIFYGLKREEAARFSLLLSLPVLLAAGLLSLWQAWRSGALSDKLGLFMAVGSITAFLSALLVISFLMRYIKRHSLLPFAVYLFVAGLIFIALKFVPAFL